MEELTIEQRDLWDRYSDLALERALISINSFTDRFFSRGRKTKRLSYIEGEMSRIWEELVKYENSK